jgi:hypothetical protein
MGFFIIINLLLLIINLNRSGSTGKYPTEVLL